MHPPPFDARTLTVDLVRQLLTTQFPQWATLPIQAAEPQGWDNRTFRLGSDLSVRLPSAQGYVRQIEKEHRWLPVLAGSLSWPIPVPVALGQPGHGYPFPWSVYGWLAGQPAGSVDLPDLRPFAADVARFLSDLQAVDRGGGPPAGAHSFHRGGALAIYDEETRECLTDLAGWVNTEGARAVWDAALVAHEEVRPVWFHGDMAVNNLLVAEGRLVGVIDFGCCGVGDPACDLVPAWTVFRGESRVVFRAGLATDARLWARARGWALWKVLLQLRQLREGRAAGDEVTAARQVLLEILDDHRTVQAG
ncbi:aminoglycoside phosphotransferase family protein [Deinococcus aquiradiocola]|uniref:Aminoglycoside phosphotransferase n=1 Tax=Deinococcus aquiradiocola TaxID=393059 RepID=A0A917PHL3_9DEIO|nr:aminoglycoside phosphotransferase family protein [Deinococcus aquiradiocola]GGJ79075.1 aminoglycoside phosphotransferase [Deinococcus aquiradiocola]